MRRLNIDKGFESMLQPRTNPKSKTKSVIDHRFTFRFLGTEYVFEFALNKSPLQE